MKNKAAVLFLVLGSMFYANANLSALEIPARPTGYVNDTIGLLTGQTKASLEATLADFEKTTSNQVVVAIFNSLDGQSLEDFSIRLAEKWKIGQKDKNNGVILLIFKEDRKVRIEVGYGLEGALPDALCSQIIRNEFVPAFRAGDFDGGVQKAVSAIIGATRGEYKAKRSGGELSDSGKGFFNIALLLFIVFWVAPVFAYLGVIIVCMFMLGFPAGLIIAIPIILIMEAMRRFMLSNTLGSTISSHSGWGGSSWGSGGGFSGGGGGFGGGGGGGFGGGGSSGGW